MNYKSRHNISSCSEELPERQQMGNLKTTEKNLTKGIEDDLPKSHASQRSTESKNSLKSTTTKKERTYIDYSDPDYKQTFMSSSRTVRSPYISWKSTLPSDITMPHTSTPERTKIWEPVNSMSPQLQHPQSGPCPSSAGKSAIPDVGKPAYEKTPEQKGLMLILNFSKDREGSLDDVGKLREFFKSTFEFDMEIEPNLTKDGLIAVLTEIRDSYMNAPIIARKYYCFICVVMSHGDKDGIKTNDDKRITMDEITSYFKNKQTPGFLGKPKIFIVQACRGLNTQSLVVADDSSEDIKDYVGKMSVPHDADILIAYATTQGYKAFRTINSDEGAWFIHVLLQIIEESYKVDHFEDMLISVRYKIALGPEWSKGENCQMPCSWTTLTKRFYLK